MTRTFILLFLLVVAGNVTVVAEPISGRLTAATAEAFMHKKFQHAAEASLQRLRLGEVDIIFCELPRFEEFIDAGNLSLQSLSTNRLEVYRLYQMLPPGMQSSYHEFRWGDDRTRAEDSLNRLRSGNFLTPRMEFDDELFDFNVWLDRGSLTHESLGTSQQEIAKLRQNYYCSQARRKVQEFADSPSRALYQEIRTILQEHGSCA